MKIKSLLLGSAAAMLAVTGAQAADAIVVEPEPVEYVRVCDAYGAGFFYIPGTETCIRFGGYVRSSYAKLYVDSNSETLNRAAGNGLNDTMDEDYSLPGWAHRGRLDIDTRNETDWGTLRAQFRIEGGDGNGQNALRLDRALISIAGFRFGFTDYYWATNHGYAGVAAEEAQLGYGGWFNFDDATIADYTFAANGFALTVGVEDPTDTRTTFGGATTAMDGRANFYAGFNWSDSWGSIAFTAAHDSVAVETNAAGLTGNTGGWAYKASISLNLASWIPGGVINAYWQHDGDYATTYVENGLLTNPETIWGVTYQMNLTDELQGGLTYWHADGSNAVPSAGSCAAGANAAGGFQSTCTAGRLPGAEGDAWQLGAFLNWFPAAAPGFSVRAGYLYGEVNDTHAYVPGAPQQINAPAAAFSGTNVDYHGFEVVVRRNF